MHVIGTSQNATSSGQIPNTQTQALLRLLEAYEDALECNEDTWQLALQMPELQAEGIAGTVLRRLVAQGLVSHARETTRPNSRRRTMQRLPHLQLCNQSCFVLNEEGVAVARSLASGGEVGSGSLQPAFVICDDHHRELRLGSAIVKQFWAPATNQELVLIAYQEQNWARCISDPIPPKTGLSPKRRLHDTIARLNKGQIQPLLRFHGDGSGQAIYWEILAAAANSAPTNRPQPGP